MVPMISSVVGGFVGLICLVGLMVLNVRVLHLPFALVHVVPLAGDAATAGATDMTGRTICLPSGAHMTAMGGST